MTTLEIETLLERYERGTLSRRALLQRLAAPAVADLGFAQVDLDRPRRKGFPEVIYGAGKTPPQVVAIAAKILEREPRVLITPIGPDHARALKRQFPKAVHHAVARCVTIETRRMTPRTGTIAILSAGTSDLPVAEEAAVTARIMGNPVLQIFDCGVAGLHRLLRRLPEIAAANVVIVVAGMEGALPSVVAGLVSKPVIAVPTSIGYGASFHGLAALLGMLNSCGSGVTVVNIDNGFGAGYAASQINALVQPPTRQRSVS